MKPTVYIAFIGDEHGQWPYDGRAYLRREAAEAVCIAATENGRVNASVAVYEEVTIIKRAIGDEVVFYAMEAEHLERLKNAARRLYTERRMDGDEMRDFAHSIMTVVRYAESLSALHGPGELMAILCPPKEKP